MNFKEKYINGNNFIISPRGKISRVRYLVYALILDILYKLLLSMGTVLGKEISSVFFILGFLVIPILILKLFNYKKRAYSFLNNNFFAYLYSIFYLLIGGFIQEYLYFLDLSNKKGLYKLTQDTAFQQYANVNIPTFINSNYCSILFNILCGVGLLMFLFLVFKPTSTTNTTYSQSIEQNTNNKDISNKVSIFRKTIIIPSIILYLVFLGISYSEIRWRAYDWMYYYMSNQQVDYVNNIEKTKYEKKLSEYNESKKDWNNCLKNHPNINERLIFCNFYPDSEPEAPTYFIYGEDYLGMNSLKDYFGCTIEKFSLFSNKCGNIEFNSQNRQYGYKNFHPYLLLTLAITCLFPICIWICTIIEKIFMILINLTKKINIKNFKLKINFSKRTNLTNKLQELNALKEQGLITEEDYNNKKSKLLEDF